MGLNVMKHKMTIIAACWCSVAAIGYTGPIAAAPREDDMKNVVLSVGGGRPDAKELGIKPTRSSSNKAGYYIPKSIPQAIAEMERMLPPDLLRKIREDNGIDSDFYDRDAVLLGVAVWMYQNWGLGDEKSPVGKELRGLGFDTQEWMGRALLESLYEKGRPDSGRGMKRLSRRAFVDAQDELMPLSSPPPECISGDLRIHSNDLFYEENKWTTGRTIYWVACQDGTKLAYLWEREWFKPDSALLAKLVVD